MKLSIVVPVHNEEGNIKILYTHLNKYLKTITRSYEILFVDDGSIDGSLDKITQLRRQDKKVKLLSFSRNFGHMSAISAGLKHASGEWVVVMDADMQDPPRIIPELYRKATGGFDVVYGVKKSRKESVARVFLFSVFYNVLDNITSLKMPHNAGTFSILNRRVVRHLNSLPEKNKFFSGLRVWAGFKQGYVEYSRGARYRGREATLGRLVRLALDGMISFSFLPLRIASMLGILFAVVSFVSIAIVIVLRIVWGFGIAGWASTMLAILLIGGVQLITLGIIGEYLGRVYEEVKNRPEYVIQKHVGLRNSKRA